MDRAKRLKKDNKKFITPLEMKHHGQKSLTGLTGFTLMELMIGMALFAMALFGMMMLLGESLALGNLSNHRAIAINEARRVIEEIRRIADTNGLTSVVNTDWTNWANNINVLTNENTTVTDLQGGALQNNVNPLPIRVMVSWTEKGKTTLYAVDTLVTQR